MRKGKNVINYETLGAISHIISSASDMVDVCHHVVSQLTTALELKGCAILLLNRTSRELEVAASNGLSQEYLHKGPLSALKSITASLEEGPVAIYDVSDDPRIQYPEAAEEEGIASILSVPIMLRGKVLGVLRLYTGEPWEFSMQDITFVAAIAEMIALVLDNIRTTHAYKTSIDVLKTMRPTTRPYKDAMQT
ncbi:GAF domain-containing protein [Dethiosulfatarculus sandiegensis]|uniref:Histidine kinase n=1 Tax=Dethiosulfatarculus sandiegensis TaxID=1429043 RepID=A0A0D2HWH0_9BACT|nr:GAF domain-containing protein [Dethiosulfatarculus sandiegensis]KIX14723.1 histidine kinase [Dethiosulfatarculus sandiegensis]